MASERRVGQRVLGKYRLERCLGRGAFGEVWAARHETLERLDALKFVSPEKHAQLGAEARILARLQHPNIVQVHDVDLAGEQPTLVMDYIDGGSLRQRMERQSPLPVGEAVSIARAVLAALEHAHSKGILHRDVKPENVLLGADGVVRLGDFGLGKLTETEISMLSTRSMGSRATPEHSLLRSGEGHGPAREAASVAGTLAYMAPEQKRGAEDARSDVYAVGALLYEMLTGERPEGRFPDPSDENSAVGAGLNAAILRALESKPERRFATAAELSAGLVADAQPARSGPARVVREPAPVPSAPSPEAPRVVLPAGLTSDLSKALVQLPAGTSWPSGAVVSEKDGSVLVLVPAGEAVFGSPDGQGSDDEHPQFRAHLPVYYIGVTEVTNAQYKRFVDQVGHRAPTGRGWGGPVWTGRVVPPGKLDHPVVYVDWDDAQAYCAWAGVRLPTELEWERAARGTLGWTYPWGSGPDSRGCRCVESRGRETTAPVGSYVTDTSPAGAVDMAGNVREWCADWYDARAYARYAAGDMAAPSRGSARVVRGGCWYHGAPTCRSTLRYSFSPGKRSCNFGFRVAVGA